MCSEWQPIETAPKGEPRGEFSPPILLLDNDPGLGPRYVVASWSEDPPGWWLDNSKINAVEPPDAFTHWMPLPKWPARHPDEAAR